MFDQVGDVGGDEVISDSDGRRAPVSIPGSFFAGMREDALEWAGIVKITTALTNQIRAQPRRYLTPPAATKAERKKAKDAANAAIDPCLRQLERKPRNGVLPPLPEGEIIDGFDADKLKPYFIAYRDVWPQRVAIETSISNSVRCLGPVCDWIARPENRGVSELSIGLMLGMTGDPSAYPRAKDGKPQHDDGGLSYAKRLGFAPRHLYPLGESKNGKPAGRIWPAKARGIMAGRFGENFKIVQSAQPSKGWEACRYRLLHDTAYADKKEAGWTHTHAKKHAMAMMGKAVVRDFWRFWREHEREIADAYWRSIGDRDV